MWVENHTTHDILLDEDQGWQAESASRGSFVMVEFGGSRACRPSFISFGSQWSAVADCRKYRETAGAIESPSDVGAALIFIHATF
jgi:hypothetical protein